MEDDHTSLADSPEELVEQSSFETQKALLQTYLDSLPYECETIEEMQVRLEHIVGKIYICAKTQNWLTLTTWDGLLQCWLLLRYPMQKTTRAKLVRLYYELCLLPGVEARVIRTWTDMLSQLLSDKPGQKRKLEAADLQLDWRPLWRALDKEINPKQQLNDPSRNLVNIFLYLAEQCKRYFSANEVPVMLDTFIPLVTKESILVMIPVFTSFLPPASPGLYLPALFKLWEAFNSAIIDDRLIELSAFLSEEHVSGTTPDGDEMASATWKDVGIWSDAEWKLLVGKGLGFMNVPVGASKGAASTGKYADTVASSSALKIKKNINRYRSLAKIFVYSMAIDGPVDNSSSSTPNTSDALSRQAGFAAGSKALDSVSRLITSTESFFHPSNTGPWSLALTSFLQCLASEFIKRIKEEELESCKTPVTRRLTAAIRRKFVTIVSRPALLAMFAKDPLSAACALSVIRVLATLEPSLIMPELLERAYSGLEVVNETHRTTAVLNMMIGISQPLVTEKIWPQGQKHLVPLLELSLPGIDLNDPGKTLCATAFIIGVVQHIKIGDLSIHQSGRPLTDDEPSDTLMEVDDIEMPEGIENDMPTLSREEERILCRESTAGFADWITALFRRVLALYENLPEEGGSRNVTGGKQEEAVLNSIKNMLDVVCLHLSDQLFDLVLKLVFEYATTNAKSNAVKAFAQLISALAQARPEKTLARFFPFCMSRVEEELNHGASCVRTTASTAAVPSDTTLHWNLVILRGCLGYGGAALLKYKAEIMILLKTLVAQTKNERGFSSTGRLITRVLHTISGVYPLNGQFVNQNEWISDEFDRDHNLQWGKLYEAKHVTIDWHVPSADEIDFILEILDDVLGPVLDKIEALLTMTQKWNSEDRNDFCRYLHASRSIWAGLPAFLLERPKDVVSPCLNADYECANLLVSSLNVNACFILTNPHDPRYRKVEAHRIRFGNLSLDAAAALRRNSGGEDHIDAVLGVAKAIDVYLLDYAKGKNAFEILQKNYQQARHSTCLWKGQKESSRLVFLKRAQLYHGGRLYLNSLYRRRSALDDSLIQELVELAISPYTRVRRHAQSILRRIYSYFLRSTRLTLPMFFGALAKGNDPDRMKGALYVLGDQGIASYALADPNFHARYLCTLLECQHEDKPSIQKLVGSLASDCLSHLHEETVHTDAYSISTPQIDEALRALESEFSPAFVDRLLLQEASVKASVRVARRRSAYDEAISSILEVAARPQTHWRYIQIAVRFLSSLLRRDAPATPDVARFLVEHSTSPQPVIRSTSQRAVSRLLEYIKIRTFSRSIEELWQGEWTNPLRTKIEITDPTAFLESLDSPVNGAQRTLYVDKIRTGFLAWRFFQYGYETVENVPLLEWESASQQTLQTIREVVNTDDYFPSLITLWSQESNRSSATIDVRLENVLYFKSLAKMFHHEGLDKILSLVDPLLSDPDKFKQRAGSEILCGLMRGSRHWHNVQVEKLWTWTVSRLGRIFAQIKPETLLLWEGFFGVLLSGRDPRRNEPLVTWVLSLPLEFGGDSAFDMSKTLMIFGTVVDSLGRRFNKHSDYYALLALQNANTNYAEVRANAVKLLSTIIIHQWDPCYDSTGAFLLACNESQDPLGLRKARYGEHISKIVADLSKLRDQRLPPPRVSQSEYDKIGLTLLLFLWATAYGGAAPTMFPYAVPIMPEILRMTELHDNPELESYSSAVLYVLSAITPPDEYIDTILDNLVMAIKSSESWRLRLRALPMLVVFFYRNLLSISSDGTTKVMDVMLECLSDQNVEVRDIASKMLSSVVRCSQRQSILPLKNRFVSLARKTVLPPRRDPTYADKLRILHSAILGMCALIESFPYSVEPWMPPLTEALASHATDPPPISTTIRKCASEFKKTHQDTWHKDQLAFNEDQIQSLSSMLVGTSYYA